MTEQSVETVPEAAPEAAEATPEVEEYKYSTPMEKMQYDSILEFIVEHNALVAKINAATGDREALAANIAGTDEFSEIRNQIAELQEKFDAAVNEKVEAALANADTDATDQIDKVKDIKGTVTSGINFFKKLYGDKAAERFPKVERLKGKNKGGAAGGKRIRGFNWVVTIGDDKNEYENAANAAKALGVTTAELQEGFFAKAGVEQIKDAPDEVLMTLNSANVDKDGNKTPFTAEIRAYRTGPSGPPPKEKAATAEATTPTVASPEAASTTEGNAAPEAAPVEQPVVVVSEEPAEPVDLEQF